MKKFLPIMFVLIAAVTFLSFNVSAERDLVLYYVMTVGDYFGVEYEEVNEIANKGIEAEELPVVYFVADKAGVPAVEVADLRLEKKAWMNIAKEYKISAEDFYVDVPGKVRYEPYVSTYKKFKSLDRSEWHRLVLENKEIVNLVNLKFMQTTHEYNVYHIMRMRSDSLNFASINEEITKIKEKLEEEKLATK